MCVCINHIGLPNESTAKNSNNKSYWLTVHLSPEVVNYAGNDPSSANRALSDFGGSGWELSLVTTPTNNAGSTVGSKLVFILPFTFLIHYFSFNIGMQDSTLFLSKL